MKKQFDLTRQTRTNILKYMRTLDLEQINTIPSGFNNNIAWNLAHLPVTMNLLCYGLSNLPAQLSNDYIEAYRKGSSPKGNMGQIQLDFFKEELIRSVDQLEADYESGIFKEFKSYPTSYGVTLGSIEEAVHFNNMHEALHLGYIMAMRKLV